MLKGIGNKLSNATGRFGLKIQERSPEILMVTGIIGFVGTVVLACKATYKVDEIKETYREKMDDIHEYEENDSEYTHEDAKKDKFKLFCSCGTELVKLYAPAFTVGTFSIAAILVSNNIMKKRYAEAVVAYTTVSTAFSEYRKRVREEEGEDKDRHYMFGSRSDVEYHETVDEHGKKKKEKEDVEVVTNQPSGYARVFDSNNPNWDRSVNFSLLFLKAQESMLNNLLQTRGHVFLNEVYDALGFKHTEEGALVGWRIGKGSGDEYIDFGLYNLQDEGVRRFINGEDNVILLDFNVDGPIFNKL